MSHCRWKYKVELTCFHQIREGYHIQYSYVQLQLGNAKLAKSFKLQPVAFIVADWASHRECSNSMHDDSLDSAHFSSVASSNPNYRSSSTSPTSLLPSLATSSSSQKGISHQPPNSTKDKCCSESESLSRSGSHACVSEIMKWIPQRYQSYTHCHTFSSGEQSMYQTTHDHRYQSCWGTSIHSFIELMC